MLFTSTVIASFLTMALALWLGLYVVTRSPRSLIAWLTGLTLWTIAGLFMNVLLALNPPPLPANLPPWLRLFLPFWRTIALQEQGTTGWLQGWSVTPGIMLWHHVTTLMRPGPLTLWRWTRILVGYGVAAVAVFIQVNTPLLFASTTGDPLYLNTLEAGPFYPALALFMLLYTGMSVANLVNSAHTAPAAMPRKQIITLAVATVVPGL